MSFNFLTKITINIREFFKTFNKNCLVSKVRNEYLPLKFASVIQMSVKLSVFEEVKFQENHKSRDITLEIRKLISL